MRRPIPSISREEARRKEEELTQTRHFDPVVKPTTKKYNFMEKLWRGYYVHAKEDPTKCLQRNEPLPSVGRIKAFMEWIFDTTVGRLEEMMTLKSLKNYYFSWRAMYFRQSYNSIPKETSTDVLGYINTTLREKGLTIVRREKLIADQLDVAWLLTYLWCYDEFEYSNPRQRVQLSFILLIIIYTGTRPGTVVESSAYRGSNEAICYKDFEVIGLPDSNGGTEWVLKLRFRYEKQKRALSDNDDKVEYKWVTFREDRACRGRCPVTHFLGLAIADKIFTEVEDYSDLQYIRVPKGSHSVHLEIRASKKNIPVFRHCNSDGSISENRAMSYNDLSRSLAELGYRAKLRDILRAYNLRRGTANRVEGDVEVSQSQYVQLLGHSVKTMGASYISNISGIDGQGLINEEQMRQDHIRQLRSMSLHINMNAPNKLLFDENQKILDDPEYAELESQENAARMKWRSEAHTEKEPELAKDYWRKSLLRKSFYNRHHLQARQECRKQYFQKANNEEIRRQIREGKLGIPYSEVEDGKAINLQFVSSSHYPDRSFVATAFWVSHSTKDAPPDALLLYHLQRLCQPEPFVLYYPGESPVEGRCPVCQRKMEEIKVCDRSDHVHACFAAKYRQVTRTEFEQKCPKECKWGKCTSKFTKRPRTLPKDVGMHISDPKERQRFRNKESGRVYDSKRKFKHLPTPEAKVTKSDTPSRRSISKHIRGHIKNQKICLWEGCKVSCHSNLDLRRHMLNCHGASDRQGPFKPQFCLKHPENGWYTCEFDWEDHCQLHIENLSTNPSTNLGHTRAYHAFTAGMQCPFCLVDEDATPSKRFTQYTDLGLFNRHLDVHKKKRCEEGSYNCPVPGCREALCLNYKELEIHFFDIHNLKPKNFSLSRGVGERKPYQSRKNPGTSIETDLDTEMVHDTVSDDWDTKTVHEIEGDDWETETLRDDVNEDDWEDVNSDEPDDIEPYGVYAEEAVG